MTKPLFRCGMEAVLDLVGGKWKLLILYHLSGKRVRFRELRRLIGEVSEKMLSQQLKEMSSDGLVDRIDFKTVPPHVEYELTEFGNGLARSMRSMCDWGGRHMDEIERLSAARAMTPSSDADHKKKPVFHVATASRIRRESPRRQTIARRQASSTLT